MQLEYIKKLEQENESLKRTCEILSDTQAINDIQQSLKEIQRGECKLLDQFEEWDLASEEDFLKFEENLN